MLDQVAPLWLWVAKSVQSFQDNRIASDRYERRAGEAGFALAMKRAVASLHEKRSVL
jgi:hypothetical protein